MGRILYLVLTWAWIFWGGFFFNAAQGAEIYKPAFKTFGIWNQEPLMRLDINLWYPTNRPARELNFSPWIINAAPAGSAAPGPFPLLVLSHSTAGTRYTYHDTASWLASQGFVVAAPTHPRDCMDNMDDLFTWDQITDRMDNIKTTIDFILKDREMSKIISLDKIGLLAYGAGGTAAFFLGGAVPDCALWPGWCKKVGRENPYCRAYMREKIDKMCKAFPKMTADKRIRAIVMVAPVYGMLFGPGSFGKYATPTLVIATGKDSFNERELNSEHLAKFLGAKAQYLELVNADAGSLMAPCPPILAQELPELCLSVSEEERNKIHRVLYNAIKAFFDRYLVGKSGGN